MSSLGVHRNIARGAAKVDAVRGFDSPKAFGNAIHLYIERAIHPRKLGGARPVEVLIASATVRFIGIAILWADTGSTKPLATHSQTIHWVKPRRTQYEQISSGLPPKADITQYSRHVSKVPNPKSRTLFDNLVGTGKQCWWQVEAERLSGLEIENQIVF